MRLNELEGYDEIRKKNTSGVTPSEFDNFLALRGWYKIGEQGWHGTAYANNEKPYIIKVFDTDPAYLTFLNYAHKNQDNPHIPKIRGKYIKFPGSDNVYGVRMEKLNELSREMYLKNIGLIAWMSVHFDYIARGVMKQNDIASIINDDSVVKPIADEWEDKNAKLAKTIKEIYDARDGHFLDLHSDNFMLRGNIWVIIDPLID